MTAIHRKELFLASRIALIFYSDDVCIPRIA
jgi:hypothetical protein